MNISEEIEKEANLVCDNTDEPSELGECSTQANTASESNPTEQSDTRMDGQNQITNGK